MSSPCQENIPIFKRKAIGMIQIQEVDDQDEIYFNVLSSQI